MLVCVCVCVCVCVGGRGGLLKMDSLIKCFVGFIGSGNPRSTTPFTPLSVRNSLLPQSWTTSSAAALLNIPFTIYCGPQRETSTAGKKEKELWLRNNKPKYAIERN